MIIGLTGGIGSGKSEVSRRFEKLGIKVIDSDVIAREVVNIGSPALSSISTHFGKDILNPDGSLNRANLRSRIFENLDEKNWLENLLHPIIRNEIITQLAQRTTPYLILSSPLLFESNQHELVNRVLAIDTTEDSQIKRASARDTNNTDQIKKIMSAQISRHERNARADDIIENNGDFNELDIAVKKLHTFYLQLTEQANHP